MKYLSRRLDRITAAYSAWDRALLLLRSLHGELDEETGLRAAMPVEQWSEFNQYVLLLNAANVDLVTLICHIALQLDVLKERYLRLLTLYAWGTDAEKLRSLSRALNRRAAPGDVYSASGQEPVEEALERSLVEGVQAAWLDFQAVVTVLEEIAAEFDGLHPLSIENQKLFEETEGELNELVEKVLSGPLPEPDDAVVGRVREFMGKREELSRHITWYREGPRRRRALDDGGAV